MDIDPNNPVVQLCSEGIRAEMAGEVERALRCYVQAWDVRRDDYEACIAAHYLARLQRTPAEVLQWNRESLNSAKRLNDERVQSFYPSLYLNMGKAHEDLGELDEARQCYGFAAGHLDALGDGSYAGVVRQGIEQGLKRVGTPPERVTSPVAMSVLKQVVVILFSLFALIGTARAAQEEYPLSPDSQRQPGVPQGTVTQYAWTSPAGTGAYPGTSRDYWVYVPAQYTQDKPACVMVFQDGASFIKEDGRARVPIVFDNLIAKHEMPVTIGIFINPGVLKAPSPDQQDRFNRSFEYDGLGDRNARFLLDEIVPEVSKQYNLSTNPDDRAIAGLSSGGICAFTAAWNRPDAFHRVLSFIGSFTDLRGGDIYPALIRKTEPKPLRVFLQDGSHDLNIYAGDWWMANQTMASALEYSGYDVKFVTGDKNHDMDQGGAILPDALRWLWRDYPQPIAKPAPNHAGDKRTAILDPAHDWELVSDGSRPARGTRTQAATEHKLNWNRTVAFLDFDPPFWGAAGIVADEHGDVLFSDDQDGSYVYKVGADGATTVFKDDAQGARGLMFGTDDQLYVCETKSRRIVLYAPNASKKTLTEGVDCQDLAVRHDGGVYFTDPLGHRVWYLSPAGKKRVVTEDSHLPNGVRLSPDQSLLFVSDPKTRWVWSFQVTPDGSLAHQEPFYRLEDNDESSVTGALGMAMDALGYLYVATEMGIQVCDQPGRVVAIIGSPAPGALKGITFGGPDLQYLYAVVGGKLYKRHMLRKGTLPWVPQKPPVPQL